MYVCMYLFIYLFFIPLFVRSYLSFLSFPLSPFSVFVFAFFFLSKKYKIRTASRLSNLALFRPIYGNPRNFSLGNPDSIRESFARGILNLGLWNPDSLEMSGIQSVSPRNVIIIIIFYLLVFQTLPVYLSSLRRIIILYKWDQIVWHGLCENWNFGTVG